MRAFHLLPLLFLFAACAAGSISADGGLDAADATAPDGGDAAPDGDAATDEPGPADAGDGMDAGTDADAGEDGGDGGDAAVDGADGGGDDGGAVEEFGAEFYVALDGDDGNPGTRERPFATLERARQAVRDLKGGAGLPEKGVAVWLRGGVYLRQAALELGAEDSGEEGRPVVWGSAPGERARLAGARRLEPSAFQLVDSNSPVWPRLDPAARGQVWSVDLAAQGISDFGALLPRGFSASNPAALELFADGVPLQLARWPDEDESDPAPTPLDPELTLFGQPAPDVSGRYLADGTSDGLNRYRRDGLVEGRQYYLYRYTWDYQGRSYTAWFLAAQGGGYPGDAAPWWYLYSESFGRMQPSNGASGTLSPFDPAAKNHGFVSIARAIDDTSFGYAGDRPARWTAEPEVWLHGYWMYMWADLHVRADAIDTTNRMIRLVQKPGYGIAEGQPYYAENLLSEITRPGEWYLDRAAGRLYLWPPAPLAGIELLASTLDGPLIRVQNAAHLRLQDLTLEATRRELVTVSGGHHVEILRCELRNAGNHCAVVSGTDNGVSRSLVHHCGDSGVLLSGGTRSSLVPGRNYVTNSELHHFSRWSWTYRPAVNISGCGHIVAHNLMRDAPHSAVLYTGNEHAIEYNEIRTVCQYSSDAGAVYTGRDWGYRGNRLRFNFIHDIESHFEGYGVHGVYLDDCVSGIEVFGNVLYRVSGWGIMHGGGRDDIMHNNLIVRCGGGISTDNRGLVWITDTPGDSWNLRERLHADGIRYQEDPWASAYPSLARIPDDWAQISDSAAHWREPEGNVFSRNLGWQNGRFAAESDWAGAGGVFVHFSEMQDNVPDQDPRFLDEANLDLRLRPDSPVYAIPGWVDIPFEQIGIQ
ncbi:MAG: right-handed parallel beta-helix repeat-containing protein [Myxococcales bacterium]|nr:right-handed parallel beta-helix repeat-containing protein [Myxococcales bacterium]